MFTLIDEMAANYTGHFGIPGEDQFKSMILRKGKQQLEGVEEDKLKNMLGMMKDLLEKTIDPGDTDYKEFLTGNGADSTNAQ